MALTATGCTPIIVTGTTGTSEGITDNRIIIKSLYWLQATTAGHKLALQDKIRISDLTAAGNLSGLVMIGT
jgi:hypothetical protein